MKKRLFPLLLALLFTLSACGGAGSGDASSASAAAGDMSMDTNGWAESADTADGGSADFSAVRQNAKLILRADLTLDGLLRDGIQRAGLEAQRHIVIFQQLVILLAERVFRLGQDLDQILLAEAVQTGDDRKPAHQFRNDAEFQQIVRLNQLKELADVALLFAL